MKNKSGFGRFFSNDITLFVLSLLFAFIIWFVINANSQTESNVTISNIPITIELSSDAVEEGMQVFNGADTTASVEVSGNRITVGSLTASDIQVVALQSNSIIAPGSYTLELSAKKVGVKTNYNFASNVTPSNVTIFVDKLKEKKFDIVDELAYKVEEGYYANTSLSETSVVVKGPETEVNAIDKVVFQGSLEGTTGSTTNGEYDLIYLDKEGNVIDIKMSEADVTKVKASLTPLPTMDVDLEVDIINEPKSHPKVRMVPNNIKIAAEQSVLDEIEDNVVNIGTLNFSNLLNKKNVITYDISLPNGCKNLSDSTATKVSIDLSDYERKTLNITSLVSENIDLSMYNVVFNNSNLDITVCGPQDLLTDINSSDIIALVDFSDKLEDIEKDSVSLELPLMFEFTNDFNECWVYGEYKANVSVSKK